MKRLFIDTSAGALGLLIKVDDKVTSQVTYTQKNMIAEEIVPLIDKMAIESGFKFNQLDEIYVTKGPGSYTGERIGLTVAKIYALINPQTIVYTCSTLQAMSNINFSNYSLALLDARNNAYFGGVYCNGKPLEEEARIEHQDALDLVKKYQGCKIILDKYQYEALQSRFEGLDICSVDVVTSMELNQTIFEKIADPKILKPVYLKGKNE